MDSQTVMEVLGELETLYPQAGAELNFTNPFETVIATVLAAQCTDKRVNIVTAKLFPKYPDAKAMAQLTPEELEPMIQECGLFHTKARNIVELCRILVAKYDGRVPDTMEELVQLPGVGRKTANVVLANAFGKPAFAVDTHVFRVSNRIGLAHANNVEQTERQLMEAVPRDRWSHTHHLLIWHGRRCCTARKPACERCPIVQCEYLNKPSDE
ncbi:MAG: endonuclease III [Clostridiales bacterium]|nr:endonuclease III [Clostridiales bacterium]